MSREVVLDTETTGVDARNGDRIIEIGCVELINHCTTGRTFHTYLNPERAVSEGAFAVHGLSDAFLADKPRFAAIADQLVDFLGDARLVIHNAPFDVGFLDMELQKLGKPRLRPERVVDTLVMARRKHPGASNSLDALCARYGIDTSRRVKHGALLDAEILSDVYIELLGGRQADFGLSAPPQGRRMVAANDHSAQGEPADDAGATGSLPVRRTKPRPIHLSVEERAAHQRFIATLSGAVIWKDYVATAEETKT
ncbi:MAG: DNA polymerase III subunit epsilon [Beijerinckiaceae bacterium]|jgi:DNA polymerase-3 subunit epsilon|nr:DNA polymerase III subunit epsilon [Beijerinckiaceae bacterium]